MTLLSLLDSHKNSYTVTVEDADTIQKVKEKLSDEYGFDTKKIKLCFKGKILKDTDDILKYMSDQNGEIKLFVARNTEAQQKTISTPSNTEPNKTEPEQKPERLNSSLSIPPQPAPSQQNYFQSGFTTQAPSTTDTTLGGMDSVELTNALINVGYKEDVAKILSKGMASSGIKNITTQSAVQALLMSFPPSLAVNAQTAASFAMSFNKLAKSINIFGQMGMPKYNFNQLPQGTITPESARRALAGLNSQQRIEINTLYCRNRESFERVVLTYVKNGCNMEQTESALHPLNVQI